MFGEEVISLLVSPTLTASHVPEECGKHMTDPQNLQAAKPTDLKQPETHTWTPR